MVDPDQAEKWVGGADDPAVECGPAADVRLGRTVVALWQPAGLGQRGPAPRSSRRPRSPVDASSQKGGPAWSVSPEHVLSFADPVVGRDRDGWFPPQWCEEVDDWFERVARAMFAASPFVYALTGFDAFDEDLGSAVPPSTGSSLTRTGTWYGCAPAPREQRFTGLLCSCDRSRGRAPGFALSAANSAAARFTG